MVKRRAGLTDTRASVTGGDMTAEAPSTASADESEQAVTDAGERSATEWPTAESGSFSYLPHRNADSSPNGNGAHSPLSQYPDARVPVDQFRSADRATDDRAAADGRATAEDEATMNGRTTAKGRAGVDARAATPAAPTSDDAPAETASDEGATPESRAADNGAAPNDGAADEQSAPG